jgi:uncharacterized protein YdeI (YjbR/CyaY-like superfamily)
MTKKNKNTQPKNPKVDALWRGAEKWREEFEALRTIALDCGLTEGVKWYQACYTAGDKNIVLIHGFKEYCAFLFFKGALMKDPKGILIQQTQNVQSARQVRFTGLGEIVKRVPVLKTYIREAIEVEKAGLQIKKKTTSDFKIPEEFQTKLEGSVALKKAFETLTPGRQRAYLFYFSGAKQSQTREARIEKWLPQILKGKGIND